MAPALGDGPLTSFIAILLLCLCTTVLIGQSENHEPTLLRKATITTFSTGLSLGWSSAICFFSHETKNPGKFSWAIVTACISACSGCLLILTLQWLTAHLHGGGAPVASPGRSFPEVKVAIWMIAFGLRGGVYLSATSFGTRINRMTTETLSNRHVPPVVAALAPELCVWPLVFLFKLASGQTFYDPQDLHDPWSFIYVSSLFIGSSIGFLAIFHAISSTEARLAFTSLSIGVTALAFCLCCMVPSSDAHPEDEYKYSDVLRLALLLYLAWSSFIVVVVYRRLDRSVSDDESRLIDVGKMRRTLNFQYTRSEEKRP